MAEPSSPERDRRLAAQVRHGPRWAEGLDHALGRILDRSTRQRMRRYGKAVAILRQQLPAPVVERIEPVDLRAGILTLAVADGPLLAELKQHHAPALEAALVSGGTGVSKLKLVLRRRREAGDGSREPGAGSPGGGR